MIRRGELFLAALDPVVGNEIAKTRPVLVVSNDIGNRYSGTVTVLPVSSGNLDKIYPFEVLLSKGDGRLSKPSKIKADQIRTIDKKRLVKRIGEVAKERLVQIEEAMKIHLGIN